MNIYEILSNIQSELVAPKGQFNSFGKYKYRSCEDVLEALKPVLNKYKASVLLSDEIVLIGERYYIKATAKLLVGEGEISVNAYAREDDTKKGMDLSQLTGSTSSYARKYALNGLFAIDDTKDSDTTNTHGKEPIQEPKLPNNLNGKPIDKDKQVLEDNSLASDKQIAFIVKLAKEKNYTDKMAAHIKSKYNKGNSSELNKKEASEIIKMLDEI